MLNNRTLQTNFIELPRIDGESMLININHIHAITRQNKVTHIFIDGSEYFTINLTYDELKNRITNLDSVSVF